MLEFSADRLGVQRCGIFVELPPLLRELSFDPESVLAARAFTLNDFNDEDRPLPFACAVRLIDDCARITGLRHFGLVLGLRAKTSHLGLIGEMLRNAPTLGRAVVNFIDNHHRFVRGGAPYVIEQDPYLEQRKERLVIGYRCLIPSLPTLQFQLASVGAGISFVRELSGLKPSEVLLGCGASFVPAAEVQSLIRPATVTYDAHHFAMVFPAAAIAAPVIGADPLLYRQALTAVHGYWNGVEPDFVDQVRRLLLPVLLAERSHMRLLSEAVNMHPRTINRRLRDHGTTLRTLVNEARFDVARQLLKNTDLPVASVASAMGYSEPGVFVRAFRQWSGLTPDTWRKALPLDISSTADELNALGGSSA